MPLEREEPRCVTPSASDAGQAPVPVKSLHFLCEMMVKIISSSATTRLHEAGPRSDALWLLRSPTARASASQPQAPS